MKKILAILMISAAMVQPAAANDREVFGAVVGAVIGYQIMRATAPQPPQYVQPGVVYVPQTHRYEQVHSHRQHGPKCWNRLDRINQYGQPVYMQECRY